MGMYTHVRGWIRTSPDFKEDDFNELMEEAEDLSPRSACCVSCTTFNYGFNFCPYIFIGGEIKDYDSDWDQFLSFLGERVPILEEHIESKYEERDTWREVHTSPGSGD